MVPSESSNARVLMTFISQHSIQSDQLLDFHQASILIRPVML